ncbi:MAG: CBS domain-containing protein [Clostridia bacterium]|nr:CBS domain-containing protein [Clostridia bacterium]
MNILFFLRPKSGVTYLTMGNSLRQGLEKMKNSGYTEIPVVDKEGCYVGTVSQGGFLWKILEEDFTDMQMAQTTKIDSIVSQRILPVRVNTTMEDLLSKAADQNFVPVVDDYGAFVGIITRRDIIKYFSEKQK